MDNEDEDDFPTALMTGLRRNLEEISTACHTFKTRSRCHCSASIRRSEK